MNFVELFLFHSQQLMKKHSVIMDKRRVELVQSVESSQLAVPLGNRARCSIPPQSRDLTPLLPQCGGSRRQPL
jgi:hypothetical protein